MWSLVYAKEVQKEAKKIENAGMRKKVETLLEILKTAPFQNSPPYEKLVGDLKGAYSRRINFHWRLIYQVLKQEKIIKILGVRTHYE